MRSSTVAGIRLFFFLFAIGAASGQSGNFTGTDVGGGSAGSTEGLTNGYRLSSAGRDVGGTADQFHFAHEQRTGDFDLQVRVENVTITDAFVQAGLIAREGLEAGSRFAGVFTSSAQLGAFIESRSTAGTASQLAAPAEQFPANYPQMYLRLRRVGNEFTGFASFDGRDWEQIGTMNVALPGSVFFGMALASHNTNEVATAVFRDLRPVAMAGTFSGKREAEPLGPSNRRTGLIVSEVMYNPGTNPDTNDLEFIEIYNAESIFIELTGWKITGGVEYAFPDGFRLAAGEFAVIAADPPLVESRYGISGVLGPFTGRLNNAGDAVRVINAAGATRWEVEYESDGPWPVAADGTGHSMVLARPSYGEDDPRAWAASEVAGGSPGQVDPVLPTPLRSVVINEFLAHTDDPALDFVELYNASDLSVDISGCILTDDLSTNRFRVPAGTVLDGRGFVSFDQNELGFALSSGGETIYLLDPARERVLDVIRFGGQENGVSSGRAPDGSPTIRRLAGPTSGGANSEWKIEDVVIHELMYHPLTGEDDDQYIEIHNRSDAAVDLSGWTFVDGIDFQFPAGAQIPAGGYVVVARDLARLLPKYPQLNPNNAFGDFDGQLSRSGERIALAKRDFVMETNPFGAGITNAIQIVVSEVTYHDGGRWPELADGGGSSLELMDARADALRPSNWAASDETEKAPWTSVEVTTRLQHGDSSQAANRFLMTMLGAGECLVDEIEFIPAGSTNILPNGDFEGPVGSWRFFGNHRGSAIESSGAFSGQNVLHVRAPGDGDTANNAIRANLTRSITSGNATIRAKVRWLSGWPEVLMRVRGNWIELPARMEVPPNLGTPGQANSRRVANAGPAIFDVTHTPALPRANQPVVVTCRVSDPDGVAAPGLLFRIDPNAQLTTVVMRDDGFSGDALAGDGIFSGSIPPRPSGTVAAFRIQASDDAPSAVSTQFPSDAPTRECIIRWGDAVPFGSFGHYHMWSTAATESARGSSPDLDNTYRDATLVYGNFRVIYNVGFRDKGSPYHGGGGDFAVTVPKDDRLLGIDDRVFASTGNGGSESTGMKGDVSSWIGQEMGIPYLHSHYIRLYRNGARHRDVLYDLEQPNRYYAQSWYGGGGVKDDLFKIAIWFEFADNNSSFTPTGAELRRFLDENGEFKLSRYRWNWQIRPGTDTANDYSSIFNLVTAVNSTAERTRTLPLIADMEEWMRVFAFHRIIGNWDSYSYRVGQNMYLYAPLGQRSTLLPWDVDFVLGEGDGTTSALYTAGQDPIVQQLFNVPMFRRMLNRAYLSAATGPMLPQNYQPQVDARRAALQKNGLNLATPSSINSYLNGRRNYILGQVTRADARELAITTNGGADFTSSDPSVNLAGFAPFMVASIEVNGVPFPVSWINATNWQMSVPLGSRTNRLELVGRDPEGNIVPETKDTITVIYDGAVPQPQDWVLINEINYNPAESNAEFVELHNRHPSFAFDLSNFQLNGVGYTLPAGSFIQPNGFLVIVRDPAAFGLAYGATIPVLGPYPGALQRNGETIRLIQRGAPESEDIVIDEVRYENIPPWPVAADGLGPSLQLIDPAQDNARAGNWAATTITDNNRATPGRANASRSLLEPFPEVWLNELAPINVSGPVDSRGDRDPWLELYNSGQVAIDLDGLALTDDPQQLGKWQFPNGTRILPGQFLVIWLDGESNESSATELHTSFRIGSTNGLVILSRAQGAGTAAIDFLRYLVTSPESSFGSFPDGDPRRRRMLYVPTPGAPNDATFPNVHVVINEWMAADQGVIRDPADGQFEDWFELYNAGTNTVDLSGYFLSDSQSEALFKLPPGFQIAPKSYRLIWADNEPAQNASGRDLHVNFALSANGEEVVLFTPDEQILDIVTFGDQSDDVSEGRYPDGQLPPFALFLTPTPGAGNSGQFANRPPVVPQLADGSIDEGAVFSVRVSATDLDQPSQQLTFTLVNPVEGMTIDAASGQITWPTSEVHGPGIYAVTVRVTDNGSPQRVTTTAFRVTVLEVNQPPILGAVPDVSIDEGMPFILQLQANDSDFPAQELTYVLQAGSPAGMTVDSETGELNWTPTEAQGPGTYAVTVEVTDAGDPAMIARRTVQVTVRDINNAPVVQPVTDLSISEGAAFALQIVAADPEVPPAPLTYSLESAPAGMTIEPSTGVIDWTPDESAGPRDHSVVVVVSEPGGLPNSSVAFVLGVREVNNAPVITVPADLIARPGDFIVVTNRATDSDLPEQAISFTATGLPNGALLDSATGVLSWLVPEDPAAGTNIVWIRATDDATPPSFGEGRFRIVVEALPRVVINEIMHRPATVGGEYVELANISQFNAVDLSGWRLEGYDFVFPADTVLPPASFLSVAHLLTGFVGNYGPINRFIGEARMTIPPEGGVIRLVKPGVNGALDEIMDEVEFSFQTPWPPSSPGVSLQLIDPWEDNRRVSNWAASSRAGTNSTTTVIPMTGAWKYWQQAASPGANWATPEFSDATWPGGSALFYVEGSALPAAKSTALTLGNSVYFFRGRFDFDGYTNDATFQFNTIIDDGAVFYLNGEEILRIGMPAGAINDSTFASRVVGNAALEGLFEAPASALRQGENVIAVRVHQANAGSSDIVFGAEALLTVNTPVSFTPGAPNSVGLDLATIPPVWINEVHPINTTGIADGAGERESWFELYNASDEPVNVGGWFLSDDFAALTKFALPPDTTIPARGFLFVWADADSAPGELHVPFRLSSTGGILILSAATGGQVAIVDHVLYQAGADQSFGGTTDGNPLGRRILAQPTPNASNANGMPIRPNLVLTQTANGAMRIRWTSISGVQYSVEGSETLGAGTWQALWNGPGTGADLVYEEINPSSRPFRFYRVRTQ